MSRTLLHFSLVVLLLGLTSGDTDWDEYESFVRQMADNATFVQAFEEHLKLYDSSNPLRQPFTCPSLLTDHTATSVHRLSPAAVKVVAALGDSQTAGTGMKAKTIIGMLFQWRGLSWSVGGDDTYKEHSTLPNALKNYVDDGTLHGYSLKTGKEYSPNSHLNMAITGSKSDVLPSQARDLVTKMKNEPGVDFQNDWKVITIFSGGNDICKSCVDKKKYSPDNYKANIQEALDILHAEIPRAFVNLVEIIDISMLEQMNKGIICSALHFIYCRCASYPRDEKERRETKERILQYHQVQEDLVNSGRYDTKDDFTVTIQPFFTKTRIPLMPGTDEPDLSYFTPDCFHLSEKGQAAAAEALWNNMVEDVGSKKLSWAPGEPLECPQSNFPYFSTNKNKNRTIYSNDNSDENSIGMMYEELQVPDDGFYPERLNNDDDDNDWAEYEDYVRTLAKNESFVEAFQEHLLKFPVGNPLNVPFTCGSIVGMENATSVHQLGPAAIKVTAALGDSITAGNGIKARTIIGLLWQNRGLSWSIGGDDTFTEHSTIPNALKKYTDAGSLHGYSVKGGPRISRNSHFNVAAAGAKAKELPGQARMLVDRMKNEKNVDFENDWKIITIFIGGNDICKYCKDKKKYSVENFRAHIQETLDILHDNIPRAFVNMVPVLNAIMVKDLNKNFVCSTLHLFLCPCAAFPWDQSDVAEEIEVTRGYRKVTVELVNSGRYDTRNDFTVVIQPFFSETKYPVLPSGEPDLSYFSPDCFHLSEKGHAAAAEALWNNMNEPVGSKHVMWSPGERLECPLADYPYFYTNKNRHSSLATDPNYGIISDDMEEEDDDANNNNNPVVIGVVVGACVFALILSIVYVRHIRSRVHDLSVRSPLLEGGTTQTQTPYVI